MCGIGRPEPENALIQISADELSWGEVKVGESVTKSFSVKNTGSTDLTIGSIQVVASDNTVNPPYFTLTPNSPCTLSPDKSMIFSVVFAPESAGEYNAVVTLKSNAGNVAAAARQLGLSERIIHYKIDKQGITPEWYRPKKD